MDATQFVAIVALEWWRSSGDRTKDRLRMLVATTVAPYPASVTLEDSLREAYSRVHSWEMTDPAWETRASVAYNG